MNLRRLRFIARNLGFPAVFSRKVEKKIPGEAASKTWAELRLLCPCGTTKHLWVSDDSVKGFAAALREHIDHDIRTGRLPNGYQPTPAARTDSACTVGQS